MTVSATASEISYAGDGISTIFTVPFEFGTSADLKVTKTDSSGNVTVLSTGYSASGGGGATGSLTLTTALAAGYTLTILDDPERSQDTDYVSNDAFPAASHETALDKQTRLSKRLWQLLKRCIRTADGDPVTDLTLGSVDNRKGKYLFFNAVTGAIEYAASLVNTALSQSIIGQLLNPQTPAESAAGVTPTNYAYAPGDIRRYGASVDGITDDTVAWRMATDQCYNGGSPVEHKYGTSMAALINYRPGVTYRMGSNAIVKCLPNQANFAGRVFTTDQGVDAYDSAADSAPVVWLGGIIDGNESTQGDASLKEHNAAIFLGAAGGGGRLVARIIGTRVQNTTGDGIQVHSNVDVSISDIEAYRCWRSGVSITGAYCKVRGSNWRLYGDSTYRSDFDIETDGTDVSYNNLEQIDVELSNIDIEHGTFEISPASATATSSNSRIILSNINHRGISTTVHGRGSIVRISNSILTWGPIDGSSNRLLWPTNFTFENVSFVFSEGSVTATSTFGIDIFHNTAGTTDTDQILRFINCGWRVDSTIESGDTVYGIYTRAQPAASNNSIEIIGGYFSSDLDAAYHTLGGGKLRIKGCPTFNCTKGLELIYSSTNFWDVEVHGPIEFGSGLTTYLSIDQGSASNVIKHYGVEMDEAFNVLVDVGGSPGSNTFLGRRTIYVASAPTAATHGNKGDIARIKAPAAAGVVDYVCTTRGVGSGAAWKALTTAAA